MFKYPGILYERSTPFMRAVYRANLEAIREMAKWMEDAPEVKAEDIG